MTNGAVSQLRDRIGVCGCGTHPARFGDFDDGDAVTVCSLHLDVQLLVPDDENDVDWDGRTPFSIAWLRGYTPAHFEMHPRRL